MLFAKNDILYRFLNAQTLTGSSPKINHKIKKAPKVPFLFWCGRWDLNPQGSNIHRSLRPARLPVPPRPHIKIVLDNDIILKIKSQATNSHTNYSLSGSLPPFRQNFVLPPSPRRGKAKIGLPP